MSRLLSRSAMSSTKTAWSIPQNSTDLERVHSLRWASRSLYASLKIQCFVSLQCDRISSTMSIGTTATTQTIPLVRHKSGVIRVEGTRVSVDSVLCAFLDGSTPEEIVQQYPSLRLADVYTMIAYYLQNRAELDGYLSDRKAQRARLHKDLGLRHDLAGIRDRLLARRSKR
jgi:uncharacterized protein (DUF433 family)